MEPFYIEKLTPAIKPYFYLNVKADILAQLTKRYPELSLSELNLLNQKFNSQLETLQDDNKTVPKLTIGHYFIELPNPKIDDYCLNKNHYNHLAKQVFSYLDFPITTKELFYSLSSAVCLCINSKKSLSLQNITIFFISHKNKSLEHKKLYDQLKYFSSKLAAA